MQSPLRWHIQTRLDFNFILGYFSNDDLSGKRSFINSALLRRIVSSFASESFMQNTGAPSNAPRAVFVSVHTTGELRIVPACIVLYIVFNIL